MLRECVTCGRESDNKKEYFELSAKIGPRYICRECAAELGIKNFMSAGFNSNTGVLKKYLDTIVTIKVRKITKNVMFGIKTPRKSTIFFPIFLKLSTVSSPLRFTFLPLVCSILQTLLQNVSPVQTGQKSVL